jgi:D-3-phosphoglycerate dehydrogenase
MQVAADRGLAVEERHERRSRHSDSVRLELETDAGITAVEGAVILGKPRLILVDGIYCEAPLEGHITFLKNADIPGVVGFVGGVFGKHGINIAAFSLGRQESGAEAVSVITTDHPVPEGVLAVLLENPAVRMARSVKF